MLALRKTLTLAAAAVAVAMACIGCGSSATVGVASVPTPAPTAASAQATAPAPTATPAPATTAPTPPPSSAALPPTLDHGPLAACDATDPGKGCLSSGTYQLSNTGAWPVTVTLDVPAGWLELPLGTGWEAVVVADPGGAGSGWGVMFYTIGDVAHDPCDSTKGWIPAAQVDTPQKLAGAMAAWPHFTATTRHPITLDGHSGVKFTLTATTKSTCTDLGAVGHSAVGASVDAWPMVNDPATHGPVTVEIVDTGHGLLVIRATDFPQTTPFEVSANGLSPNPTLHAGDQANLHAILDSVRISVPPTTP